MNSQNITTSLLKAGLTENEAKLYLNLLEIGPKSASILAKRAGLHRRVVYDSLERLIKKGLVSYIIENKTKIFSPSNPKRIAEIIKEEESFIEQIMPEMMAFFNQKKENTKRETSFFKGIEGLKSIFEDQIEESKNKEILILGASELAYEMLDIYFHWFDKKRIKNKIKTKIIFNNTNKKFKIPLSEIKYLPEKYSSNMAINIYKDKVAIILWRKQEPFAILIKEEEIAKAYRKHFEAMWRLAKE